MTTALPIEQVQNALKALLDPNPPDPSAEFYMFTFWPHPIQLPDAVLHGLSPGKIQEIVRGYVDWIGTGKATEAAGSYRWAQGYDYNVDTGRLWLVGETPLFPRGRPARVNDSVFRNRLATLTAFQKHLDYASDWLVRKLESVTWWREKGYLPPASKQDWSPRKRR